MYGDFSVSAWLFLNTVLLQLVHDAADRALECEYARSVAELRLECEHGETGGAFAQGRVALLQGLLRRGDSIFHCEAAESELGMLARKNIDAELKRLAQRA